MNSAQLQPADWAIVGLYLLFTLAVGFYWSRRAGRDTTEFFLSGRSLPWWLAGTSMVATTFGSDTPLLVAGIIGQRGIAGNWWWWSFVMSNMLTVFFFARLWRRSGITTDVELSELRYGGAGGRWLRGVRALYFGGLINVIVIGWIMLGGQGIVATLMGLSPGDRLALGGIEMPLSLAIILALIAFVTFYSTLAGLWGVVSTDLVQFTMAMVGCLALAYYVVTDPLVGGLDSLRHGVIDNHPLGAGALSFFPSLGGGSGASVSLLWFGTMMCAQWWASWYPGSEPGGGGYIVQRILASRSERDAQLSTLWFSVAHYAVRPWPWILVALAGFVIWPDTSTLFPADWQIDPARARELTFIAAIPRFLPTGLAGLMVAALIAALMSTVDTHMNWGASYVVNDFYQRFLSRDRSPRHYVRVSRLVMLTTIALAVLLCTGLLENIQQANELVISIGAGAGPVYILRWFWPRINAWAEISSMIGAFAVSQGIALYSRLDPSWLSSFGADDGTAVRLLLSIALTSVIWISVSLFTPPESDQTLDGFYRRCRPPGPGWRATAARCGLADQHQGIPLAQLADWAAGCLLIWSCQLLVGDLLLDSGFRVLVSGAVATISGGYLIRRLSKVTPVD